MLKYIRDIIDCSITLINYAYTNSSLDFFELA